MRLVIFSDVFKPANNGINTLVEKITKMCDTSIEVMVIHPGYFKSLPIPWYQDVEFGLNFWHLTTLMRRFQPTHFHIVSEGFIGLYARLWLSWNKLPFTSSYHTMMDIHVATNVGLSKKLVQKYMLWFHSTSKCILANTDEHLKALQAEGYPNLKRLKLGVEMDKFIAKPKSPEISDLPIIDGEPIAQEYLLYVGRLSKEKNIEAFLDIPSKYTKVVVGSGKMKHQLQQKYPAVLFAGKQTGKPLVKFFQFAKMLVMPSRSETLGMVIMEAMACNVPVAAYPVNGPNELITDGENGYRHEDLAQAIELCLTMPTHNIRQSMQAYSWEAALDTYLETFNLVQSTKWDNGRPHCD